MIGQQSLTTDRSQNYKNVLTDRNLLENNINREQSTNQYRL